MPAQRQSHLANDIVCGKPLSPLLKTRKTAYRKMTGACHGFHPRKLHTSCVVMYAPAVD
jgi:uncharacterized protein VirK/YbjX